MNKLDRLNLVGQTFEDMFRSCKNLPQYKYFTVPIYKFCVGKIGTVAATGVSFLAADLVIHQLVLRTIVCLTSQIIPNDWRDNLGLKNSCNFSYNYISTLFWACIAMPVMYAKYKKLAVQSRVG